MEDNFWLEWAIIFAVLAYPLWRIFARVGLNPALSLFAFIPVVGWWIAGAILAYARWPKVTGDRRA